MRMPTLTARYGEADSVLNNLMKPYVLLSDVASLFERTHSLVIKASKIGLDVLNIMLKVRSDEIGVLLNCSCVIRQERSRGREANLRPGLKGQIVQQKYNYECHPPRFELMLDTQFFLMNSTAHA